MNCSNRPEIRIYLYFQVLNLPQLYIDFLKNIYY